jgi:DNA-binding MarR family transcriptional regulator
VVYVSITEDGLGLLTKIDNERKGFVDLSENLSEEEAELLSNLLDKMRG